MPAGTTRARLALGPTGTARRGRRGSELAVGPARWRWRRPEALLTLGGVLRGHSSVAYVRCEPGEQCCGEQSAHQQAPDTRSDGDTDRVLPNPLVDAAPGRLLGLRNGLAILGPQILGVLVLVTHVVLLVDGSYR